MPVKKSFVLDTNVLLVDPNAFYNFGNHNIVVPFKVLEELDKKKNLQTTIGANARSCIRTLDKLRKKKSLCQGARIGKGKGLLYVLNTNSLEFNADMQIISTAKQLHEKGHKVIIVSRDINVRVRSDAFGIPAIDYETDKIIEKKDQLYTGFSTVLVDDQVIDQFYNKEPVFLTKNLAKLYSNQFVMLMSSQCNTKTAMTRFISYEQPLRKAVDVSGKHGLFGLKPRNKEQQFAMELLMDSNVPVVSLIGCAGSGKTLTALAAGLQQTISNKETPYQRLVIMRPVMPLGKDLGFLPGSMEEKMAPYIMPIVDNLRYLMGNDRTMLDEYIKNGVIEIEPLTYIRGRSLANSFIIADEFQNATAHEIKTVLTRVGENTKIVVTGDLDQIDNFYINETTSGLTNMVEKMKGQDIYGHITLVKGERSKVATVASKVL